MKTVPRSMVSQTLFVGWMLTAVAMGQGDSAQLERVLARMDETARAFRSAQATLTSDQYQKVINETETQKGKIYFRREAGGIQMAIDFDEPDKKYIVYSGGKIQMYQPKIDQVMEYSVGADHEAVESFLVLGFGGSGEELKKSFDVTYEGEETIDNIATGKLKLVPKSAKIRANFPEIMLWIDLSRGISVQQKLMQNQGDYRVATCVGGKLTPDHKRGCAKAIDYLASRGMPDDVELTLRRAQSEPGIFGHKLKVPPGCKLAAVDKRTGRIECGSSAMAWAVLDSAPPPHRLLDEAVTSASSMGGKQMTDERLGCTVEGKAGRCAKLAAMDGTALVYVGTTVIEGHGVLIVCTTMPTDPKVPAVCNESISLP